MKRLPNEPRPDDWLEWLSDHSAGGYVDVTIPATAVSHLCGALEDPKCKALIETWGTVILQSGDLGAVHGCVEEMMRRAGVRPIQLQEADDR